MIRMRTVLSAFALLCLGATVPAAADTGGPDAFGYSFIDSDEPGGPLYSWIDLTTGGTALNMINGNQTIPIGFDFDFYGTTYTSVNVSPSGVLYFGALDWFDDFGTCIPGYNYVSEQFIAVYWEYVDIWSGGDVYYQVLGAAPHRKLVVEWHEVQEYYWYPPYAATFEAILEEGNGRITLQYHTIEATNGGGQQAVVGIQDSTTLGLEYSCFQQVLDDGLAIAMSTCTDDDLDADGWSECQGDCDDGDATAYPGATEVCDDGVDQNCDGQVNEQADADADGFTNCTGDCNDFIDTMFPGNPEVCDGLDNDCDGDVDEDFDADGDGWAPCAGDCDDTDATRYPGAPEFCDGVDTDCDGTPDNTLMLDQDGDGYTGCDGDCHDGNASIFPGAPEACDGIDSDCDGDAADENVDGDGDGQTPCAGDCDDGDAAIYTGQPEVDNTLDDDCDGLVDEDFVASGDLVISELMPDPLVVSDTTGQWLEVANVSGRDVNLRGWELGDTQGLVTMLVDVDAVIPAGGVALLAGSADPLLNGGLAAVDWAWDDGPLPTTSPIALWLGPTMLEELPYDSWSWPSEEGVALSLMPSAMDATANDDPANWCLAHETWVYGYGDLGTPGDANGECCYDVDGDGHDTCGDDGVPGTGDETECDDAVYNTHVGAMEVCDGLDNDCDGAVPVSEDDADGDGQMGCDIDCDDTNADVYAGAPEICDGVADNNCDGEPDFTDIDGDADGHTPCEGDCADAYDDVYPGADELCDGLDNDCDGEVDEDPVFTEYHLDADADGYGDPWMVESTCDGAPDASWIEDGTDCDDADAARNPGADEVCDDGIDNDCDGDPDGGDTDCDSGTGDDDDDGCAIGGAPRGATPGLALALLALLGGLGIRRHRARKGAALALGAALLLAAGTAAADTGGPDAFGYRYIDSDEPTGPTYSWLDITATGTLLNMQNGDVQVPVGFDFDYYGVTYNNVVVGGPGVLYFDPPDWFDPFNDCLPYSWGMFDTFIAVNWDDFDGWYMGMLYYELQGAAPNRQLVVSWHDLFNMMSGDMMTFQVILHEHGSRIVMQYHTVDGWMGNGQDATVGIQQDTSHALQYSCLQTGIANGMAIDFFACDPDDPDGDGYSECDGDCDQSDASIHPWAAEVCDDGIDSNCDGVTNELVDGDGDGYSTCDGDCHDGDNTAYPGNTEVCDLVDNNCDGTVDEGFDTDGDGYATCGGDCDDTDAAINPGALDDDCDGVDDDCDGNVDDHFDDDQDADGVSLCGGDCDDADELTYPGAPEICDGIDNDCDGLVTDEHFDGDGDGWTGCGGDCDDNDAQVFPMQTETDDGADNDCDGLVDEDFVAVGDLVISEIMAYSSYVWEEGAFFEMTNVSGRDINLRGWEVADSYGWSSFAIQTDAIIPAGDVGLLAAWIDPAQNGGLVDVLAEWGWEFYLDEGIELTMAGIPIDTVPYSPWNGNWPNQDGWSLSLDATLTNTVSNNVVTSWCLASAGDTYGQGDHGTPGEPNPPCCWDADGDGQDICGPDGIPGTGDELDCDDNDPDTHVGAPELCDLQDNDCDGVPGPDEVDADGDGVLACAGDCDDTDPTVHPGAPPQCDGLDTNCDGVPDSGEQDLDGDGYSACDGDCHDLDDSIHPGAEELCDGLDNDCDGTPDDNLDFDDWHMDYDADGYGDPDHILTTCDGAPAVHWILDGGDCNDGDPNINPDGVESCFDLADNDCDGEIDDEDPDCEGATNTTGGEDDGCSISATGTPGVAGFVLLLGGVLLLWRRRACPAATTALLAAALLLPVASATAATGGPDAYGYSYFDSDEPGGPTFDFIDLTGTGTTHSLSDDSYSQASIGFAFPFYGTTYETAYIQSNGGITFSSMTLDYTNGCLPYAASETLIALHWDDLNPNHGGTIYSATQGTEPHRIFTAHWYGVPHINGPGGYDFQIQLHESGRILLLYRDVSSSSAYTYGSDATVGIQGDFTEMYLQYSCISASLADDLAIEFSTCDSTDLDGDGFSECDDDCNDYDPALHPGDQDMDGISSCDGDCDDLQAGTYPGAAESCDGLDNDCDGFIDEDLDQDHDGYTFCNNEDCNDLDGSVNPAAKEIPYDGIDQDCDGFDLTDVDGDGWPGGTNGSDCADMDATINPGLPEVCDNGRDDNCDGVPDEHDTLCGGSGDTGGCQSSVAPGQAGVAAALLAGLFGALVFLRRLR